MDLISAAGMAYLGGLVSSEITKCLIKDLYDSVKGGVFKKIGKAWKSLKRVAVHIAASKPTTVVNNLIIVNTADFKSPAELKKFLSGLVGDNGMPDSRRVKILSPKSVQLLKFINSQKGKEPIVATLKPYIPPSDFRALEASLLMREYFRTHKDGVDALRDGIIERFGDRGRRITNLCTAGYFEDLAKLCKENCSSPEGVAKFKSIYETIIGQEAFAVFVMGAMSEDETKKAIFRKAVANIGYGKRFVDIHGIGKINVKKIGAAIKQLPEDHRFPKIKEKEIFHESKTLLFIRLYF